MDRTNLPPKRSTYRKSIGKTLLPPAVVIVKKTQNGTKTNRKFNENLEKTQRQMPIKEDVMKIFSFKNQKSNKKLLDSYH